MPKILIVDDESGIRNLLRLAFSRAGYEVTAVASGLEAISQCSARNFDVLLSDVRMPQMDGHELARWVAAHYPHTKTVLMSGYDPDRPVGDDSPRCSMLPKPSAASGDRTRSGVARHDGLIQPRRTPEQTVPFRSCTGSRFASAENSKPADGRRSIPRRSVHVSIKR